MAELSRSCSVHGGGTSPDLETNLRRRRGARDATVRGTLEPLGRRCSGHRVASTEGIVEGVAVLTG